MARTTSQSVVVRSNSQTSLRSQQSFEDVDQVDEGKLRDPEIYNAVVQTINSMLCIPDAPKSVIGDYQLRRSELREQMVSALMLLINNTNMLPSTRRFGVCSCGVLLYSMMMAKKNKKPSNKTRALAKTIVDNVVQLCGGLDTVAETALEVIQLVGYLRDVIDAKLVADVVQALCTQTAQNMCVFPPPIGNKLVANRLYLCMDLLSVSHESVLDDAQMCASICASIDICINAVELNPAQRNRAGSAGRRLMQTTSALLHTRKEKIKALKDDFTNSIKEDKNKEKDKEPSDKNENSSTSATSPSSQTATTDSNEDDELANARIVKEAALGLLSFVFYSQSVSEDSTNNVEPPDEQSSFFLYSNHSLISLSTIEENNRTVARIIVRQANGKYSWDLVGSAVKQNPFMLLTQMGFININDPSSAKLLQGGPKLRRALEGLDKIRRRQAIKIALLYVQHGQTAELDILRNQGGSAAYAKFIEDFGSLVNLKEHGGFVGGLDERCGEVAPYWADNNYEVVLHTPTLMPNEENDPKLVQKKRHVGNDIVTVVWDEHDSDFDTGTIKSQFNDAHVIVYPLTPHLFRIQIRRKTKVGFFGPLTDGMIVTRSILPFLVKMTAINANQVVRFATKGYKRPQAARDDAIQELVNRYKADLSFGGLLSRVAFRHLKVDLEQMTSVELQRIRSEADHNRVPVDADDSMAEYSNADYPSQSALPSQHSPLTKSASKGEILTDVKKAERPVASPDEQQTTKQKTVNRKSTSSMFNTLKNQAANRSKRSVTLTNTDEAQQQ